MNDSKQSISLDRLNGSLKRSDQTLELGLESAVTESTSESSTTPSPEDERSTVAPSNNAPSFVQGSKLAVLVACTCMAVFLQALVGEFQSFPLTCLTNPGHHHHRNCDPLHHQTVRFASRCWLVWLSLLYHVVFAPASVGPFVHFLPFQVNVHRGVVDLRGGKRTMRRCAFFSKPHCWTSNCRCWFSWNLLW